MHPTSTPSAHTAKQVAVLRKRALAFPETHEDFPWGHSAFKVKGKAFAFLHADADGFSLSVKLPDSNALALHLPFAEPTGYGLGKSGWVTGRFGRDQDAPLPVLAAWLEESFTSIAPKRVLGAFIADGGAAKPASSGRSSAKSKARAKPAPRTAAKGPTRKAAAPKRAAPAKKKLTPKSQRTAQRARKVTKKSASARAK